MALWQFDNNSGRLQFTDRQPDETAEEKKRRELNIKNRLSGADAGLGAMFSGTEGGVQRVAAPGAQETVATTDQRDLPDTVSTGRTKELSDSEEALRASLKGIEGTTASSIVDRASGLQSKIQSAGQIGTYNANNIASRENLNKLFSGQTTAPQITQQAQTEAQTYAQNRLNEILNPLSAEQADLNSILSQQQQALEGTGVSDLQGLDVQSLSPKARQSYLSRMARLRDTGLTGDVLGARQALEEATGVSSQSGSELEALRSALTGQAANYGADEIGQAGLGLATDYQQLQDLRSLIPTVTQRSGRTGLAPGQLEEAQKNQIRNLLTKYGYTAEDRNAGTDVADPLRIFMSLL